MYRSFITQSANFFIGYDVFKYVLIEMLLIAGAFTYFTYIRLGWPPVATFLVALGALLVFFAVRVLATIFTILVSLAWGGVAMWIARAYYVASPAHAVDPWTVVIVGAAAFAVSFLSHRFALGFVRMLEGKNPV